MNSATATEQVFRLHDVLRAVAGKMETPVVAVLILLILSALVLAGWLTAEFFTQRRHLKLKLPALLDEIQAGKDDMRDIITASGLLKNQRAALTELTVHPDFNSAMREALAIRLLEEQQAGYDKILKLSDTVAKLGPIFGLLGTLIPLGPGIIALGQGDTFTLSASLLTAFDTTVAGLLAAAVAMVVSAIRGIWYRDYMSALEVLANCVLEAMKGEGRTA